MSTHRYTATIEVDVFPDAFPEWAEVTARMVAEEAWADVLPPREVEQEVLDILDGYESASR